MTAMLTTAVEDLPCAYNFERIEAIKPTCSRGSACRFNESLSPWSASTVYRQLEKSHTRKFKEERRAGSLGNWLSHVSAWRRFIEQGHGGESTSRAARDGAPRGPMMVKAP